MGIQFTFLKESSRQMFNEVKEYFQILYGLHIGYAIMYFQPPK